MPGRDPATTTQPAPTRDRLIETAISLFGEYGIEATSLRALTEAAGANIAAVNYHFRSKEGLLRAVIDETMGAVNDERRRRLEELETAPEPPTVAGLVRAFVEPGLALHSGTGRDGAAIARFIGRVISEPNSRIRQIFADQVDSVEGRYLAALGQALPGRNEDDVRFAYISMLGLLGIHQSGAFTSMSWPTRQPNATPDTTNAAADTERLIAFITAGALAATEPPEQLPAKPPHSPASRI